MKTKIRKYSFYKRNIFSDVSAEKTSTMPEIIRASGDYKTEARVVQSDMRS